MTNHLQLLANDVAGQFLGGLGSLQDLTRKVSEDQSLSSNEIERVAQLVNKEVQIRMYSERGPKGAFEFDMVEPSSIIDGFNNEYEDYRTEKVANSIYIPKKKFADEEEEYTGSNQFTGDFLIESKARLELDLEEMEEAFTKTAHDIEDGYNSVYAIVKQALIGEEATAEEIVSFVSQSDEKLTKIAEHIVNNCVKDVMDQAGLPDSMIICKDPIPVDKFEGSRAMVKQLNTLIHQHDIMEVQQKGTIQLRESVRYVVEGINSHLRGTMNVD